MRTGTLLCTSGLVLVSSLGFSCGQEAPKKAVEAAKPVVPERSLTLLVTGHEFGTLPTKGPRLLAQWTKQDKWPDALAFSTGDMFSGDAISAYFEGASTAEFAKALLYRASAVGNHDFDLGIDAFNKFRNESGVTYLAANLVDRPSSGNPLKLEAFKMFERDGIKVGVVGLTGPKTLGTQVNGRASEFSYEKSSEVVGKALAGAKAAGVDVTLVLYDDCISRLSADFEAHADWDADLVVGAQCDDPKQPTEAHVRKTTFLATGDELSAYVAARYVISPNGDRTLKAVIKKLDPTGPEDQDLVALRGRWQAKLDQELGDQIGFTKSGLKATDPKLGRLVATALREQTKSDIALVNKKGLRGDLPKGKISKATVYTLLPFTNAVVVTHIPGSAIEKLKANPEAIVVAPPTIDKAKTYQLVTIEYLYFGGDGLGLEAIAQGDPELTGQVWQTPVTEWLRKIGSNEKKPLEKLFK